MFVHVIADTAAKLASVRSVLERRHDVTSELLGRASISRNECNALVIKTDLRIVDNILGLKKTLGNLTRVRRRVFLLDQTTHLSISQAYAFGATRVLAGPVSEEKLLWALTETASPGAAAGVQDAGVHGKNAAVSVGTTAITSMFAAAASGAPIDVKGTKDAGSRIADQIAEDGLSNWLATIRRHHEGTYQHCLLVTGVAIDFGLSLGLRAADMERLYSAAMFHDIGKATIPLTILDKPGGLDASERTLIETHAAAGYDVLKDNERISPEILDAVRHHHEYLDGSGYPDGLGAESISDVVRILTISDIFSALIEDRRYRPPMSREDAYNILCGMHGKLEKPLVASFKDVALNR
jgi:putative nucleotidyltransferase with HDIG domain